jgi:hypothetical protein
MNGSISIEYKDYELQLRGSTLCKLLEYSNDTFTLENKIYVSFVQCKPEKEVLFKSINDARIIYPKQHFYRHICREISKLNFIEEVNRIDITNIKKMIYTGYDFVFLNYLIREEGKNITFIIKDFDYQIKDLFGPDKYRHPYAINYWNKYSIDEILKDKMKGDDVEKKILEEIYNSNKNSIFNIVSHTFGGILGDNYVLIRYGPPNMYLGRYYFFVDDREPLLEENKMIKNYVNNIKSEDNRAYIDQLELKNKQLDIVYNNLGRWTITSDKDDKYTQSIIIMNHTALKLMELEKLAEYGKLSIFGADPDVMNDRSKLENIRNGYFCDKKQYRTYGFATNISYGHVLRFYYHYTFLRYQAAVVYKKIRLIKGYKQFPLNDVETCEKAIKNRREEIMNDGTIINYANNVTIDGTVGQILNEYIRDNLPIFLPGQNTVHLWTANTGHLSESNYNTVIDSIEHGIGGGQASGFTRHTTGTMPLIVEGVSVKDVNRLFQVYPINYYAPVSEKESYSKINMNGPTVKSTHLINTIPLFKLEEIKYDTQF